MEYWVHYTIGHGRKHIKTFMHGADANDVRNGILSQRCDSDVISVKDKNSPFILTTTA